MIGLKIMSRNNISLEKIREYLNILGIHNKKQLHDKTIRQWHTIKYTEILRNKEGIDNLYKINFAKEELEKIDIEKEYFNKVNPLENIKNKTIKNSFNENNKRGNINKNKIKSSTLTNNGNNFKVFKEEINNNKSHYKYYGNYNNEKNTSNIKNKKYEQNKLKKDTSDLKSRMSAAYDKLISNHNNYLNKINYLNGKNNKIINHSNRRNDKINYLNGKNKKEKVKLKFHSFKNGIYSYQCKKYLEHKFYFTKEELSKINLHVCPKCEYYKYIFFKNSKNKK